MSISSLGTPASACSKTDSNATLFPAQALPHALIGVQAFHAYPYLPSFPHSPAPQVYVQAS